MTTMSRSKRSGMSPRTWRRLRLKLGLTQAELAKILGMSSNSIHISRYETGAQPIPEARARHLKLLAELGPAVAK